MPKKSCRKRGGGWMEFLSNPFGIFKSAAPAEQKSIDMTNNPVAQTSNVQQTTGAQTSNTTLPGANSNSQNGGKKHHRKTPRRHGGRKTQRHHKK